MMPALVSGTVVVWEVQGAGDDRVVRPLTKDRVSIFTDGAGGGDASTVISEYIVKLPNGNARPGPQQLELLQKMRDGLLQVYDIQRTALQAPPLPP
jgi:hypothetical protein